MSYTRISTIFLPCLLRVNETDNHRDGPAGGQRPYQLACAVMVILG